MEKTICRRNSQCRGLSISYTGFHAFPKNTSTQSTPHPHLVFLLPCVHVCRAHKPQKTQRKKDFKYLFPVHTQCGKVFENYGFLSHEKKRKRNGSIHPGTAEPYWCPLTEQQMSLHNTRMHSKPTPIQ